MDPHGHPDRHPSTPQLQHLEQWAHDGALLQVPAFGADFASQLGANLELIWMRLTASSGGAYDWVEVVELEDGSGWTDLTGGAFGHANAREASGNANVPTGSTIVLGFRTGGQSATDWRFLQPCSTSPTGIPITYTNDTLSYVNSTSAYDSTSAVTYTGTTVSFVSSSTLSLASSTLNLTTVTSTVSAWNATFATADSTWTVNAGRTWVIAGAGAVNFTVATVSFASNALNLTTVTSTADNWAVTFGGHDSAWTINTGRTWTVTGAGTWQLSVANVAIANNSVWTYNSTTSVTFNGLVNICAPLWYCWSALFTLTGNGGKQNFPRVPDFPVLRLKTGGGVPIPGLTGFPTPVGSRLPFFHLVNEDNVPIPLYHNDAGGPTNGKLKLPGGQTMTLLPGDIVPVTYDPTDLAYRVGATTPTYSKGDLPVNDGTKIVALPVGSDGQVLSADSTQSAGFKWTTPATGGIILTKLTFNYINFAAAATSQTITLKTMAAGEWLIGLKINVSTGFTGGGVGPVSANFGYSGGSGGIAANTSAYRSSLPMSSASPAPVTASGPGGTLGDCQNQGAGWSLTITAQSTGGNLNALTAGVVDVWILTTPAN